MKTPDFVALALKEPALRFLIIGGYAVGLWGYYRPTKDTDFLARQSDRGEWKARAAATGLKLVSEMKSFAQFRPDHGEDFDIMFVNEETFTKLWDGSVERSLYDAPVRVPALDHLIALKLHALKQELRHRTFKDANDVEQLVRHNGIDLTEPKYEELFLKHGTREIYETFLRVLRH